MTTPHQGLPDTVETLLGTGAYEIGGAGTDFGQAVDESVVTNLFRIPNPTEANKVDVFEQALSMLPADSLAAFEPVIPDFDPADTPENWIDQLMAALFPRTTPTQVQEDQQEFWDSLWSGFLGLFGLSGATAEDIGTAAEDVSSTANTALYSTETNSAFFNQPRVLPAYVGALSDEVCFARYQVDGTSTPALGTLVLIPVKITADRTVDALKVGMTSSGMTSLHIGLWDCDETTGDLSKVLDLGDRKADLNLTFSQQTFELDEPVGVQAGEVYYIGVLQVGGTASAMHRNSLTTVFSDGFFPKNLGNTWTTTGISSLPADIDAAEVASGTRYWGAIGTAADPVVPAGMFLSDSFNRADSSSSPGPQWTIRNGAGGIYQNRPLATLFSNMTASNNTRLLSTTQRVGFHYYNSKSGNNSSSAWLRGNGLGPLVELAVTHADTPSNNAHIRTRTSYNPTSITGRATFTGGNAAAITGDWTFEAVGNTYTGYLDGVQKLQWVDSGGAFSVASNSTEVGFYTGDTIGPAQFDDWFAQDI